MFVTFSLLLAAVCLLPAAGKLTGQPKMRQSAAHFGIPWSRYRLIGVAELAAAAGVLAGLWWHPLGLAAAAGMALLLLGALITLKRRGVRAESGERAVGGGSETEMRDDTRCRFRLWPARRAPIAAGRPGIPYQRRARECRAHAHGRR